MSDLNNKYKLHIVIPTKNSPDILELTMDSIINKHLHLNNTFNNFVFYVVDTGSDQENKDYILKYEQQNPDIEFRNIYINGYHYGKVNNYVIKNSLERDKEKEDLVLLCNNDLNLLSDCVTRFVDFYDTTDNTGVIGCKLLFGNKTIQHAGQIIASTGDEYFPTHRGLKEHYTNHSEVTAVLGNTAALALIDLDLFLDVGGFNEEYEFCFEDLQLNLDCLQKGKTNYYLGDAVSYHFESINKEREGYDIYRRGHLSRGDYAKVFKPYIYENREFFDEKIAELVTEKYQPA